MHFYLQWTRACMLRLWKSAPVELTHCITAGMMVSLLRKCCPCNSSFFGLNRWKSEGTKSGLNGRCGRLIQPILAMCFTVFRPVWCPELSCCKRKVCQLLWPYSGCSSLQLSQCYDVAVRADCLFEFQEIRKAHPFPIPKDTAHHLIRVNFFMNGEFTCCYFMGCCFDCGS